MFRSLFGSSQRKNSKMDWQKSKAHLLLLSKFLEPRSLDNISKSESWQEVLRESPQNTIDRFLSDGVIVEAGLNEHLAYKFKVTELKTILKRYNLPVSGRKDDLIARLIQADSQGMKDAVADITVYCCTEQGREIAEQYLNDEKEHRIQVEQSVREALRGREFQKASQLVATFEAGQVFQRGINIEWKDYDPKQDVVVLGNIFDIVPKALAEIKPEFLEELQIAAGMMYLWGTNRGTQWLSNNADTQIKIDNSVAIGMLHSHAIYLREIADYKRRGIKRLRILNANDPLVCDECKKLADKTYRLDEIPSLPYEKCTCEFGCRCWIGNTEF